MWLSESRNKPQQSFIYRLLSLLLSIIDCYHYYYYFFLLLSTMITVVTAITIVTITTIIVLLLSVPLHISVYMVLLLLWLQLLLPSSFIIMNHAYCFVNLNIYTSQTLTRTRNKQASD